MAHRTRAERRAEREAARLGRQADGYARQAGEQPYTDTGPVVAEEAEQDAMFEGGENEDWLKELRGQWQGYHAATYGGQEGRSLRAGPQESTCEPGAGRPPAADGGPSCWSAAQFDPEMLAGRAEAEADEASRLGPTVAPDLGYDTDLEAG